MDHLAFYQATLQSCLLAPNINVAYYLLPAHCQAHIAIANRVGARDTLLIGEHGRGARRHSPLQAY